MSLSGCISPLSSDDKADRLWIDLAEPAIEDFPQFVVGSNQAEKEEIGTFVRDIVSGPFAIKRDDRPELAVLAGEILAHLDPEFRFR